MAGRASSIIDGRVLDIAEASGGALGPDPAVIADLAAHPRIRDLARAADVSRLPRLDSARLGAPLPKPGKVVAIALNYRSHAVESGLAIPDEPHVMAKFPNCVTGPFDQVRVFPGREKIDYEAEVVLAIGKKVTALTPETAWDCVAGIMVGQDISDRGEQFRPPIKQFTMAKSYDTFGPVGPMLVTPDELPSRDDLEIIGRVDGVERQRGRTSDLIFPVPVLLTWLTRFVTFYPGDLIFTGTPGGVGESLKPPVFLKPGSVLETEIPGVGLIRNPCVA